MEEVLLRDNNKLTTQIYIFFENYKSGWCYLARLDVNMMLETVEKKNLSGRFICCINMVEIHLRNRGDDSFDGSADCWQLQSH
ncbi:hypothetical protein Bca4012_072509 [Brassica carinata]